MSYVARENEVVDDDVSIFSCDSNVPLARYVSKNGPSNTTQHTHTTNRNLFTSSTSTSTSTSNENDGILNVNEGIIHFYLNETNCFDSI